VNFNDFAIFASAWKSWAGEPNYNSDCDISNPADTVINYLDLKEFCAHWLEGTGPIVQQLNVLPCDRSGGSSLLLDADLNDTRFAITVQDSNLYFQDMIKANCCKQEIRLDLAVEGNYITIHEIEVFGQACLCECDLPTSALIGPSPDGDYTVEVFDVDGNSLGIVDVTILSQ
jgi:hypothetical protein